MLPAAKEKKRGSLLSWKGAREGFGSSFFHSAREGKKRGCTGGVCGERRRQKGGRSGERRVPKKKKQVFQRGVQRTSQGGR